MVNENCEWAQRYQGRGGLKYWLDAALTSWHSVALAADWLDSTGIGFLEADALQDADSGYVVVGGSALLAFRRGSGSGFRIITAHTDSPCFRLKPVAVDGTGQGGRFLVAPYGGMIAPTWMDRPLLLAGRIFTAGGTVKPQSHLLQSNGPVSTMPNACIHFNRGLNDGYTWGFETDLRPLFPMAPEQFLPSLAEWGQVAVEDILSWDLALVSAEKAAYIGTDEAWLQGPRLDNQGMVHAGLSAFLQAKDAEATQILLLCDHEEVGSLSRLGAESFIWRDLLYQLAGDDAGAFRKALQDSLMLSADQAHGLHPNYPTLGDSLNGPLLNGGPVLKTAVNQSYAGDGYGTALLQTLAKMADIPLQVFANRADIRGGATMGPILSRHLPIPTIDVGNPLWAMHSIAETAGVEDQGMMITLMEQFYEALSF